MKILLLSWYGYCSGRFGAAKANRLAMEALAERGHACLVLTRAAETTSRLNVQMDSLREARALSGASFTTAERRADFALNGVSVRCRVYADHAAADSRFEDFHSFCLETGSSFDADVVLVCPAGRPDDFAGLLEMALSIAPERVVTLIHSLIPLASGFGPNTVSGDPRYASLLRRAAKVVVPSEYVRSALETWGDVPATVIPPVLYGHGPYPNFGNFGQGLVMLINPGKFKGIAILLELAKRLPHVGFGAVPTWNTTQEDLNALEAVSNMRVVPYSEDVDDVYRHANVLLVPSLGPEAFGAVAVEAMARGIPVLASDYGGLREAKLGVEYSLPVRPLVVEQLSRDEFRVAAPMQDLDPWLSALDRLLTDRDHYDDVAARSRVAALTFIESLSHDPFERLLAEVAAAT
jgi:glycosyltransferase involved in cell wall biosynthesis